MAVVDVPAELLARWQSRLPAEVDAGLQSEWAAAVTANGAAMAQAAAARILDGTPWLNSAVPPAKQFLGLVVTTANAAEAIAKLRGIDQIEAIQGTMLGLMQSLAQLGGLASSVPLIGAVVQVGMMAQRIWWRFAVEKKLEEYHDPTDIPWVYDRDSDEVWVADALDLWHAHDLTPVFLPRTRAERLILDRVRQPGGYRMRWQVDGERLGLGVLPGLPIVARGWQGPAPWTAYRPGAEALAASAWSQALASSRVRYWTHAAAVRDAWADWWARLRCAVRTGGCLEGDKRDRWRGNIENGQVPRAIAGVLPPPSTAGDTTDASTLYPFLDVRNTPAQYFAETYYVAEAKPWPVVRRGIGPDLGSWAIWQADVLRDAQYRGLDTLLVAYVSEGDPAFRDAELADRLEQRRRDLLERPAALWRVDTGAIPDADYAAEVRARKPRTPPMITAGDLPPPERAPAGDAGLPRPVIPEDTGGGGEGGGEGEVGSELARAVAVGAILRLLLGGGL